MKRQRESNFELLRILLMITIPLYHSITYGGILHQPYNEFTIYGFVICSGGAIVADYAFMALSSYFFLEHKNQSVLHKMFILLPQVLIMYFLKIITIYDILKFPKDDDILKAFFIKGAWWFIYVYFIVLLIYPILNKIIYKLNQSWILLICVTLGFAFIYIGFKNESNLLHDTIAFLFTYFVIGYLKRNEFTRYLGMKNNKINMMFIYFTGYFITIIIGIYVKMSMKIESEALANEIVQRLIGKYSIVQFLMGIAIFLIFRSINIKFNKWINMIAKNIMYVFLLHETVLAIFWHFGKLCQINGHIGYDSISSFIYWNTVYLISVFIFAILIRVMYYVLFKKIIDKYINIIINCFIIRKFEEKYFKITEL